MSLLQDIIEYRILISLIVLSVGIAIGIWMWIVSRAKDDITRRHVW